ncbi:dephospho-CoA kinase [Streptococcus suis]|uniref:dephospho-CoA kinase n=1 Tax=Streptococcus TaxID=1301 RepID=UPI00143253FD|nr:dephospho-CoA kinase [Streptococcus suis]
MAKVIGLTGGIASGKSTVTAFLREKGYQVIDADAEVHDLQKKGGRLYQVLLEEFGPAILAADGQLDRVKLGQQVFADSQLRARLSELQDQIIRQELLARRDLLSQTEEVVFMDIPLLYELDYSGEVDEVWLVYVDERQQLARLMARNGYSLQEAENRLAAQLSLEKKKERTDKVIDNSGSLEATLAQVASLVEEIGNGRG